jgi:hypothetical protein
MASQLYRSCILFSLSAANALSVVIFMIFPQNNCSERKNSKRIRTMKQNN